MTHDEFAQHEDEARDLIEALGKLSRDTQASPNFAARVMAQADQLPAPRRGLWLLRALLWPATPAMRVTAAAFGLIVLFGAVSHYVTWIRAYTMGVPSGALREARLQGRLWQKNFECATQLDQHSANYAAITSEHVTVVTWACPSGDVLVMLESPSDDIAQRSVWVALDFPYESASLLDRVIPPAFAAADAGYAARRVAPITAVLCQKVLSNHVVKQRVQRADGTCEDRFVNTANGRVVKQQKAPCNTKC